MEPPPQEVSLAGGLTLGASVASSEKILGKPVTSTFPQIQENIHLLLTASILVLTEEPNLQLLRIPAVRPPTPSRHHAIAPSRSQSEPHDSFHERSCSGSFVPVHLFPVKPAFPAAAQPPSHRRHQKQSSGSHHRSQYSQYSQSRHECCQGTDHSQGAVPLTFDLRNHISSAFRAGA